MLEFGGKNLIACWSKIPERALEVDSDLLLARQAVIHGHLV